MEELTSGQGPGDPKLAVVSREHGVRVVCHQRDCDPETRYIRVRLRLRGRAGALTMAADKRTAPCRRRFLGAGGGPSSRIDPLAQSQSQSQSQSHPHPHPHPHFLSPGSRIWTTRGAVDITAPDFGPKAGAGVGTYTGRALPSFMDPLAQPHSQSQPRLGPGWHHRDIHTASSSCQHARLRAPARRAAQI